LRYDEACEESFISTINVYKHLLSCLSLSFVFPQLCNKQVVQSGSLSFSIYLTIIIGDLAFRTGYHQLCVTTARRVFFAVAAFPDSSPFESFCGKVVEVAFLGKNLYRKSNAYTLLVIEPITALLRKNSRKGLSGPDQS
jgi:hypothetical protein